MSDDECQRPACVEARRALALAHERRASGGYPWPDIDTTWANVDQSPPDTAHDPAAPPLFSDRGSQRLRRTT